jgi:hypothetical protein
MKIVEQFTRGKTGDDTKNEDRVAVTPDFIGVFDGVTSRAGFMLGGMSTGTFAAGVLADALAHLPPDMDAYEAVPSLNKTLHEKSLAAAKAEGKTFTETWSWPAAALLVYSRARREIWRVADSTFVVDGQANYKFFPQETTVAELRRAFFCAKLARGMTEAQLLDNDISWDLVTPIISELKIFANYDGPFGYGVLNGSPVPKVHIEAFPAAGAKEIIFASDGYPTVLKTLTETEAELKRVLAEDPLMYKLHPQVKGVKKGHLSFDDRSYIRFQPA